MPALSLVTACGAVYPEVATPVRSVPPGKQLEPEPPGNLLYIVFDKVIIPKQTRDGRKWDAVGGAAPDPFAKLLVNGQEIIKTPTESDTMHPTWPTQVRANYRIEPGDKVVVEVWDSNPIHNDPICVVKVDSIHDKASDVASELLCNSGARVQLRVESARPKLGLGLSYELQAQTVKVTRVIEHSPAASAGLSAGVEIVAIQGKNVAELDADQIRSVINANGQTGLRLDIKLPDGTSKGVEVKEAAMYPVVSEGITF
ncbi:MAG TPA: PDZ domain-containing protein [Polyangiaceae bacterium]|nr:PDZ domain-containing protein [Polyangiaceae bacterium]